MAFDKLVDSTQLNADLTTVANTIRSKGGTSAQLAFPDGMVEAIEDIPKGLRRVTGRVTLAADAQSFDVAYDFGVVPSFILIADIDFIDSPVSYTTYASVWNLFPLGFIKPFFDVTSQTVTKSQWRMSTSFYTHDLTTNNYRAEEAGNIYGICNVTKDGFTMRNDGGSFMLRGGHTFVWEAYYEYHEIG